MSSRTSARLVAFGALFATAGALATVVTKQPAEPVDAAPVAGVGTLADEAGTLSRELEDLDPDRSARAALGAARAAMAATRSLREEVGETADDITLNAIEREIEYLDATGSLLTNPRSTLRTELSVRAERANAALAAAPGGDATAAAQRGWDELLRFAEARRRR